MNGHPGSERDNTLKRSDTPVRALSEIYEELGFALLHAGDDLSAEKKTTQADSRYEEAAQAFRQALLVDPQFRPAREALLRLDGTK